MSNLVIGLDIGGTNMRGALVDPDGGITGRRRCPRPRPNGTAGLDEIVDFVCSIAAGAGLATHDLAGIGVGIPGWVDHLSGELIFAPKFAGWQDLQMPAYFRNQWGCPVHFGCDPHMAALGEWWMGAGRGHSNFVMVTLGTGIGCGIVIDGRLYTGHHGFAPEFGHTVVAEVAETDCSCGVPGCLESLAAGPAIGRAGREAARTGHSPQMLALAGGVLERITAEVVVSAAKAGDSAASQILEQAGKLVGLACANLVTLLEPELIIVGGGLSTVGELLLGPMRQAMAKGSYLISRGYVHVDLVPAELLDDAGTAGAACLAFRGGRQ
jgi:glucokinase